MPGLKFEADSKLVCKDCLKTVACICEYQMRELDLQMQDSFDLPHSTTEVLLSQRLDSASKTILFLIHAQCQNIIQSTTTNINHTEFDVQRQP